MNNTSSENANNLYIYGNDGAVANPQFMNYQGYGYPYLDKRSVGKTLSKKRKMIVISVAIIAAIIAIVIFVSNANRCVYEGHYQASDTMNCGYGVKASIIYDLKLTSNKGIITASIKNNGKEKTMKETFSVIRCVEKDGAYILRVKMEDGKEKNAVWGMDPLTLEKSFAIEDFKVTFRGK